MYSVARRIRMTEGKTPNTKGTNWKIVWYKFTGGLCFFVGIIMWIFTAIMKVFNFCLEIILILCGQIKLVSRVDDDK